MHDPVDAQFPDGRIAPVSRLAKQILRRHRDRQRQTAPGFAEGYRVQRLIDAAQRSHQQGTLDRCCAHETAKAWSERAKDSRHRRQRLHRLGAGEGAGQGRRTACACSTTIRAAARAGSPMSRKISNSSAAIFATPPRSSSAAQGMDEVHHLAFVNGTEFFYSQPDLVLDVGVHGHDQCDRRLPQAWRRQSDPRLELGGLSDAAARCRPTRARRCRAGRAQSALFLRRRQAHQRTDGDQLRPQIFRARADLPPAQCLWPRHGLGACRSAIRAAAAKAAAAQPSGHAARSTSRAPARRPAASAMSTIWSPASW